VVAAVDWGDVPTWFASGSSLLALLFAAAAVIAARRTFRIELERDQVNAAARAAQDAYFRRGQASRVSTWWGTTDSGSWGAFVRNASDAPVYQAHLTVVNRRDDTRTAKLDLAVIPPASHPVCHTVPIQATAEELDDLRVTLTFTDATGVRWMRDEYGRLTEFGNELRVWFHGRIGSVLEQFASDFRRAYGVRLGFDTAVFGELQDRFVRAVTARDRGPAAPDMLFAPHDWIGGLAADGAIQPIIISAEDRAYFGDQALAAMSHGGRLYGLPVRLETVVLYRNPELVPDPPATMEELLAAGTALRDAGRVRVPLALPVGPNGDPFYLHPLFTSAGGRIFGDLPDGGWDLTDVRVAEPASVRAFERIRVLGEQGSGALRRTVDLQQAYRLFLDRDAPFLVATFWGADRARQERVPFAVSPVPPFRDGRPPQLMLSVSGFVFAARSPNHALALDLVADFLTRPDVTETLAETMAAIPAAQHFSPGDPVLVALAGECAKARPMPAVPQMRAIWGHLGRAQVQLIGGAEVAQVTSQLARELAAVAAGEWNHG
jgi:arabinogalactan oligomer/maltooligosaccharide transport system substrate-binding protein